MSRRSLRRLFVSLLVMIVAIAGLTVSGVLRPSWQAPGVPESALRDGDLIFVRGSSLRGLAVVLAGGDSSYSHVGLVRVEDGHAWVIHASPGEGAAHYVQKQTLADFLAGTQARRVGIYRLRDPGPGGTPAAAASAFAQAAWEAHAPFDDAFSLATVDALYCTELVWRAYLAGGTDLCDARPEPLSLPFMDEPIILPSALAACSRAYCVLELR
jgi:hypothetical protein